ncbi:MAG: Nif3-like dinuclear metal center hexameric protein [Elusimicrobiales bacterium]
MAGRDAIVKFADIYLHSAKIPDASLNGLQVEGARGVKKIAFGVSASYEFLRLAAAEGAQMAFVHHGLIWSKPAAIRGTFGGKIRLLLEHDMSLAAYHLPLDMHPETGNNAQIISWFGAANIKPFGDYHGNLIGLCGRLRRPLSTGEAAEILSGRIGGSPAVISRGPEKSRTIAVISGGASSMIEEAHEAGADLYISGDRSETVPEYCREAKMNFISGGHYNTEKAGILAFKEVIAAKFPVKTVFIDVPNPF